MVDYDANLIAVAVGATSKEQTAKVLQRIDAGPCTHARGTWVSEKRYEGQNCYGHPPIQGDSKVYALLRNIAS